MNALPDVATYQELGAMAPEPDTSPPECWCGRFFCGHDPIPWPADEEREPIAKEDR